MAPLVLAKDLLGLSVAAMDIAARVGKVRDILLDTDTGEFLGVTIVPDWLSKPKFITADDIAGVDAKGLVINKQSDVVELDDVVKVKKHQKKRFRVLGLKTQTVSGKQLGKIQDMAISMQTNKVVKFYIGALLHRNRVIPWHKVIKIDRHSMTVEDDIERVPAGEPAQAG